MEKNDEKNEFEKKKRININPLTNNDIEEIKRLQSTLNVFLPAKFPSP